MKSRSASFVSLLLLPALFPRAQQPAETAPVRLNEVTWGGVSSLASLLVAMTALAADVSTQPRVIMISDFPPLDVIAGGGG